ncbi:DMT family transporter [Wenzhouxiangella sp. XN79A]|uniref:DMT family transporter n=1 Tax=Wenzhouxiangella sp. XN79A TaxID=2724193 RepID=UPI00144A6DA6|nr:DMT family transporter [Wenzhouxiangella sp. XN79A]NKI35447.1 DMT family transporter [Wenzhouxiangella sp. XN79A]
MTASTVRATPALLVTAGAVMISFAAVFVRLADVPATTSAFYRLVFGAAALAVLLALSPRMRAGFGRGWAGSAVVAAFFAADLWFWHRSILYIGPGLSTLLANFQVFVLATVGVVWLKERVGWRFAAGTALAMLGLWLLFGRDWAGLGPEARAGIVLGLLTACAYAGYLLTLRGVQVRDVGMRPEARLLQVSLICAVLLGGINLIEGHGFAIPDRHSLASLIALGVVCQVLGWLAITRGLPGLPASLVGLLLLLQPLLSMVWDLLWFELTLVAVQWLGAGLALAGIYLGMQSRAARR